MLAGCQFPGHLSTSATEWQLTHPGPESQTEWRLETSQNPCNLKWKRSVGLCGVFLPREALEGGISFTLSPKVLNWLFWALSVSSGARQLGDLNRDLIPFGDVTESWTLSEKGTLHRPFCIPGHLQQTAVSILVCGFGNQRLLGLQQPSRLSRRLCVKEPKDGS